MKITPYILFIFLSTTSVSAYSTPCPPCSSCWIATVGGAVIEALSAFEAGLRDTSEANKQINYITEQKTALVNQTISALPNPSSVLGNNNSANPGDFVEGKEPPKDIVVEYPDPASSKVETIMKSNMRIYADMPFADHEGDYNFVKKRQYIRQQANIQMMARILVLKHQTQKIFDIIDEMEKDIDNSSRQASNQNSLENNENKPKLLLRSAAAKIAWIKLLMIQKQLRAAQLQYNALLGLATAKRHKTYWNPEEELPEEN